MNQWIENRRWKRAQLNHLEFKNHKLHSIFGSVHSFQFDWFQAKNRPVSSSRNRRNRICGQFVWTKMFDTQGAAGSSLTDFSFKLSDAQLSPGISHGLILNVSKVGSESGLMCPHWPQTNQWFFFFIVFCCCFFSSVNLISFCFNLFVFFFLDKH